MGRLLRSGVIQPKLRIGRPNDRYEQEAERVTETVMRMPASVVAGGQGACSGCDEEEKEHIQAQEKSSHRPAVTPEIAARVKGLHGKGQPLPSSIRAFFEPRFERDFSQVRVHTDTRAATSAWALKARAYTIGRDIVFGAGHYAPGTTTGKKLLAHELTHTVQQGSTPQQPRPLFHGATGTTSAESSSDSLVRLTLAGAPDISRAPLDVTDIMNDIRRGMSTPTELFSWLHVMGGRSGEIAHAAACPGNTCPRRRPGRYPAPDPAPVPVDRNLPITACFFPSYIRHTDQRALIIGGFHGDERPGYEMTDTLVQELQQRPRVLAFHTLIIPRLNPGAIEDDLAGVTWYDRRCNRQVVDLNRNFPVPGASHSSTRCPNTPHAPIQPETQGVIDVIHQFRPHRIVSTHAIRTASSAGIFADPNTHPTATQLACSMAGRLVNPSDRPANRLTSTSCDPVYPGDRPGELPHGATLGRFAPTRSIPGRTVPVITVEAPEYRSLGTGTGARTREAFLRPLLSFVDDPATLANIDADIVRDIEAFSSSVRLLFLTGRLPTSDAIYQRIRARIQDQVAALNALRPRRPNRIWRVSHQRAFSEPLRGATPQAQIVFEKFTLTGTRAGTRAGGWDTLPDRYFHGGDRSRGVDRDAWLAESSVTRLDIILRFSAIPGASRHHWGTDVDFNSIKNAHWGATTGPRGTPGRLFQLGRWLEQNAHRVGFIKTYTAGRTGGHSEEPWHYSYEPIARPLRAIYNRDVRLTEDIVDPIMADWTARAGRANVTLPDDLRTALSNLDLSSYVNVIGPGL